MKRIWFYRASELTGPWFGVSGCRPPIWFGGDEWGRTTVVFQLPGVGCMVVRVSSRIDRDLLDSIATEEEGER